MEDKELFFLKSRDLLIRVDKIEGLNKSALAKGIGLQHLATLRTSLNAGTSRPIYNAVLEVVERIERGELTGEERNHLFKKRLSTKVRKYEPIPTTSAV